MEVLQSAWEINMVLATTDFLERYYKSKNKRKTRIIEADKELLKKTGSLTSNDSGLAVVRKPDRTEFVERRGKLFLVAENIQDPGNMGTLLRIADWYGVEELILSPGSVEVYNPKVIQASMGSFLRVSVYYLDLESLFSVRKVPLIGTFPSGMNIHVSRLPGEGYILLGNESQGISAGLSSMVDISLSIPKFGNAESLNVAVAAAVILDNFKRNKG